MKTPLKIAIILLVVAAALAAVALRKAKPTAAASPAAAGPLPRLLDLGATKCVPCKMMAPILEDLKRDFAGKLAVDFIDVWQNPKAGEQHGIQMIPTQIFFDAAGKELFRHTGFYSREDILGKWRELGIRLEGEAAAPGTAAQSVAYYFHGTTRCETCLKIQKLAKAAIEEKFAAQIAAKQLAFLSVDYDLPENKHFSDDYKLPSPSLVLVQRQPGQKEKWKILADTWDLAHEPEKFNAYVAKEVSEFLGGRR